MPTRPNNAVVIDSCTQRLRALSRYVHADTTIALDGTKHSVPELLALYEACLESRIAVANQRAATQAAMVRRAEAEQARRRADRALKGWVANEFGASSQEAFDFGFPPPRVPTRTVEHKAHALALLRATREARHTMGPKVKRAITGAVPAAVAPTAAEGDVPHVHQAP